MAWNWKRNDGVRQTQNTPVELESWKEKYLAEVESHRETLKKLVEMSEKMEANADNSATVAKQNIFLMKKATQKKKYNRIQQAVKHPLAVGFFKFIATNAVFFCSLFLYMTISGQGLKIRGFPAGIEFLMFWFWICALWKFVWPGKRVSVWGLCWPFPLICAWSTTLLTGAAGWGLIVGAITVLVVSQVAGSPKSDYTIFGATVGLLFYFYTGIPVLALVGCAVAVLIMYVIRLSTSSASSPPRPAASPSMPMVTECDFADLEERLQRELKEMRKEEGEQN